MSCFGSALFPDGVDALSQLVSATPFGIASLHAPSQTLATIDWTGAIYPDRTPAFLTGNSRSQTEYYKNSLVKTKIDELRNRTGYRYDNSDRLTEITHPDGQLVSYGYDLLNNITVNQ
ncbi:MAG: RHS repeat protein [Desertifilum sp. SIO1I2]|nr:RHS repeat protein [Desertifilum sp. SIO1I2]